MPDTPSRPPYGAFNFEVSFNGQTFGGFSDVSGLNTEFNMSEYREGTDMLNRVQKLPGLYKTGDVTLKRGIVDSTALWQWVNDVRSKGPLGRLPSVTITLYDETHEKAVWKWKLTNVTPMKLSGPTLAAKGGGDVAMEEVVLSAETITLEQPKPA